MKKLYIFFLFILTFSTTKAQINTDLPVGAIPGSADVSPTGAATYAIPIEVSPGTAGMQPNLSIVYNSQSGDGVMGLGWNFTGISAITRTGQTIYHDGKVTGITLTEEDRYMWDGNRLLGIFSAKGTDTVILQMNPEVGFSNQVFAKGLSNDKGPLSFYIRTSDGKILEYGITADSKIEFNGKALIWHLSKVTDANGNYMTYHYESGGTNTKVLSKIVYTGNAAAGLAPYAEIRFTYTNKPVTIKSYIWGNVMFCNKLLQNIGSWYNGSSISDFSFEYAYDDFSNTKLIEVKKHGRDGSKLNSTKIQWGANVPSITIETAGVHQFTRVGGDTDNDGISNAIASMEEGSQCKYYNLTPDEWGANYSATLLREGNKRRELPKEARILNFKAPSTPTILYCRGVKDDLRTPFYYEPVNERDYSFDDGSIPGFTMTGNHILLPGDFNGDGKDEVTVVWVSGFGSEFQYFYYEYNKDVVNKWISLTPNSSGNSNDIKSAYVTDINGNGKKELMLVFNLKTRYYEYNTGMNRFELIYEDGYPTEYHHIYTGDFNGDGKTDLLTFTKTANPKKWELAYSTGDTVREAGFTLEANPLPFLNPLENIEYYPVFVNDFNGDGKSDVLQAKAKLIFPPVIAPDTNWVQSVYFSRGDGVFLETSVNLQGIDEPKDSYTFGDFNGDGLVELLSMGILTYKSTSFYKNDKSRLVASITDGMNHTVAYVYNPLLKRNEDNAYNPAEISAPVHILRGGIPVVKYISYYANGTIWKSLGYLYGPLLYHSQGKGILGFKTIRITDSRQNLSTFMMNDYYHMGLGYYFLYCKSNTTTTSNGIGISKQEFENTLVYELKSYQPILFRQTATDYLTSTTVVTTNSYYPIEYAYAGFLKSSKQDFGGGCHTTTDYTYSIHGTAGLGNYIYKPSEVTTTAVHPDYPNATTATKKYNYDIKGNLTSEVDFYGKPQSMTTTYKNFNAFGLAEQVTTQAASLTERKKTVVYDAKKRFVEKITDMNGLETKTEYDYATGNITKTTDPLGNNTTYEYDVFGHLKKTNTPIGSAQTELYWGNTEGPGQAFYYSRTTGSNQPPVTTYYDVQGREICTKTYNFKNEALLVDKEYNFKGQLYRQSKPYFQNGTATKRWVTYGYDDYGRLTSLTDCDRYSTISYNGKTTTTTRPDYTQTSKTVNAMGQTVSSTDNGGTVTYTYHSNGNPLSITVGGTTTTMEYDDYGRQTKLIDANAGETRYEYNAWGELTKQTDARNQVTQLYYHNDGRLRSKNTPEGSYFYDYYPSGQFKTMLQRESSPDDSYFEYVYDNLGRQTQITQYEPDLGSSFVTQYSYDSYGNPSTTTYPTGFKIKNRYDTYGYGYLVEISRDYSGGVYNQPGVGTSIWRLDQQNASGQITKWMAGNSGLSPSRTYYEYYDMLTRISCGSIQSFGYYFNPNNGNLHDRSDYTRNVTESFTYDNLDRLAQITSTGAYPYSNNTITYQANGNIASKSDAGTYGYHAQKKHALTGITGNNDIPLATQTATYTSFSSVRTVKDFLAGTTIPIEAKFKYAPDDQRSLMQVYANNTLQYTKFYGHNFEQYTKGTNPYNQNNRRNFHYISAPGGAAMVYISHGDNVNVGTLFYLLTDHQGSITHIVNEWGGLAQEYSYDAWGRRRNPANGQPYTQSFFQTVSNLPLIDNFCTFDRGYTGHEHLDAFGLINMNGRLYDPVMGRMLSPDNYVQDPGSTQSYNRYAYCMNNPLKYTDPDGEWIHLVVGALIGGTMNWAMNGAQWNAKGLGYFGVGALAGALSAGVGAGVNVAVAGGSFGTGFVGTATVSSTGFFAGALTGAGAGITNGFITGTGNNMLGNKNFGNSLLGGLDQAWKQGLIGGISGGIIGGIHAASNGRDFWTGSYKQYDLQPTLLASSENFTSVDEYKFPDDATIANADKYKVYYKTEDGVTGVNDYVKPGKYIKKPIDGVATSKYTNKVFKVPDGGSVKVSLGGEVDLSMGFVGRTKLIGYQLFISRSYEYGWLPLSKLDSNWETLFKMALLIK